MWNNIIPRSRFRFSVSIWNFIYTSSQHCCRDTTNRLILQIPQCTCPISHNAPFGTEMCTFQFWMVHCGILDRYIVGYGTGAGALWDMGLVYCGIWDKYIVGFFSILSIMKAAAVQKIIYQSFSFKILRHLGLWRSRGCFKNTNGQAILDGISIVHFKFRHKTF